MKILLIHYRYFISGGPERYLFNLKVALENKGHEVIPFSIKNSKNVQSPYENYFVDNIGNSNEIFVGKYPKTIRTYIDLVCREFYSFKVKRHLKKLILDTKPDICYLLVYKRALSFSVVDACFEANIPIINRISDYNPVCGAASLYHSGKFCNDCFFNKDKSLLKNKCIKNNQIFSVMRYLSITFSKYLKIDDKINHYVCTNGFMKEMMIERGYDTNKLHIIPTFFLEKEEYKNIDKKMRTSTNILRMLYIGNIDESKGIYDLIDALSLLLNKTTAFHLNIVGGLHKDENDRIIELIKRKNLIDYVSFVPFRSDGKVFEYYLDNHVTILPARWAENLPNTLIESIFFNRPVVVPNWGSFKYTTDDTVAFYYEALNSSSLCQTLFNIISNVNMIDNKTRACETFFKSNYAESTHIERLLDLFNKNI